MERSSFYSKSYNDIVEEVVNKSGVDIEKYKCAGFVCGGKDIEISDGLVDSSQQLNGEIHLIPHRRCKKHGISSCIDY